MKNKILLSVIALSIGFTSSYSADVFPNVTLQGSVPYLAYDDTDYTGGHAFLNIYQWNLVSDTNADATTDQFYLFDMKGYIDNSFNILDILAVSSD